MNAPGQTEPMTEKRFERWLGGLILRSSDRVRGVLTFETAEILSTNYGLVVEMEDGTKFQVSIVQDRRGR